MKVELPRHVNQPLAALRGFLLAAAAAAIVFCAPAAYGQNVSDASGPEVSSVSLGASSIDTTSGAQSFNLSAQATDDLSGVNYVLVYLKTLANSQPGNTTSLGCYVGTLHSGTRTSGSFTGSCSFPQYSQSGTWFVHQIYAYDMVGNYRSYYNNGNALALAPATISVTAPAMPASATPVLQSVTMTPAAVDVSNASANVTVEAHVTSGNPFNYGYMYLSDPSNSQSAYVYFNASSRIQGTANDGIYRSTLTIPRYSRTGNWHWYYAYLFNTSSAYTYYGSQNQGTLNYVQFNGAHQPGQASPTQAPATVSVSSALSDSTAPTLVDFAISPASIDVATQSATVTVTAEATDDISGFSYGCVYFRSPNGQQSRAGCFYPNQPSAGIVFPQFSQAGNWNLSDLYLYDKLNNYRYYSTNSVANLGFPASIQISSGLSVGNVSGSVGALVTLSARLTHLGAGSSGKTVSFSIQGQGVGSAVTDANGVATLSGVSLGTIAAGTYLNAILASFAGDGVQAAANGSANLIVTNKLDQTITFGALSDRLLSDSPIAISATASSGLTVTFNAIGNCTVAGTSVTLTAAGSCKIVASQLGNATYNAAPSVSQTFNITAKSDQTITFPTIADRGYGDPAFALSATASSGLAVTYVASGNCTLNGNMVTSGVVGSCQIVASQSGNDSYNSAPSVARSFGILRAPLTIKADDKTKAYGAPVPAFSVTPTGLVNGDTLGSLGGTLAFATSPSASQSSPVGNYTITPSGLTSSNYTISFSNGNLQVTAVALTIKADDKTKAYGAAMPTFSVTPTGLVNGDTLASLGGTLAFATAPSASQSSPVGNYTITPSGLTSPNYTISFSNGNLQVTAVALTIKADDKTKAYGASLPAFSVTPTGLVNGDTLTSLGGTLAFATAPNASQSSPVGDYTITPSGLTSPNYTISFSNGNLQITAVALTIKADDKSKPYGAAVPAFTATVSGFVNGDTSASLSGTLAFANNPSASQSSPVGNYTITPGGVSSPNYAIVFTPGTLTVTPVNLSIKADNKTKVYAASMPAFSVTPTGLVNGDTLASLAGTLTYATNPSASQSSPVGNYTITPGGVGSPNYVITFLPGTLSITPAVLTVSANNATSQYSDPLAPLAASISGFLNGDGPGSISGTPALATTATPGSAPDTYPIVVSMGTLAAHDYTFTGFQAATYTVTRENARSTYAGILFASTASVTSNTATVALSATVRDISAVTGDAAHDPYPGDIRKATLTFVNRDAGNATLCTATIGLLDPSDPRTGTGTCNWTANIGTQDSVSFTVGIVVNGYYVDSSSDEDAIVTVSRPLMSQFITGGGYLMLSNSAGETAGAPGSRANFGFNVKYNKSGTNLQGNMNIIVRNSGKVYQVKATSIASLSVQIDKGAAPVNRATFTSKATIRDITNPDLPLSIEGNATLQVVLTDKGEPGVNDTIAITLWNKNGGLWFSSHWNGTESLEQVLAGGNVVAH